jgi:hypothetical protein
MEVSFACLNAVIMRLLPQASLRCDNVLLLRMSPPEPYLGRRARKIGSARHDECEAFAQSCRSIKKHQVRRHCYVSEYCLQNLGELLAPLVQFNEACAQEISYG